MWVIFILFIVLMVAIFAYVSYMYYTIGYLHFYLILLGLVIGYIVVKTKRMAPLGYHLHIHHYVIGMILMMYSCY